MVVKVVVAVGVGSKEAVAVEVVAGVVVMWSVSVAWAGTVWRAVWVFVGKDAWVRAWVSILAAAGVHVEVCGRLGRCLCRFLESCNGI